MKIKLAVICIITSSFSCAANVDCENTKIEPHKLICSDTILSNYEKQVNDYYEKALRTSLNKESLTSNQRIWVTQMRDKCVDSKCLGTVYRNRIEYLKSIIVEDPIYSIDKGSQYPVCRSIKSYLNSPYNKKGACYIESFPSDKNLKSPLFERIPSEKYKNDYVKYLLRNKNRSEHDATKSLHEKIIDKGGVLFWEFKVDLDNDGTIDDLVMAKKIRIEDVDSEKCMSLGGATLFAVESGKFSQKWEGAVQIRTPFIYDGKTYVILGDHSGGLSVQEPYPNHKMHSPVQSFVAKTVCTFSLNY